MRHQVLERFFDALSRAPLIMGVINVTPDSFSDGGRYDNVDAALAHARRLAAQGADLLDIGGESTRPGHTPVTAGEEQARVLPAIAAMVQALPDMPLSIDTTRAETAERAIEAGAVLINDIWGLQGNPSMAKVAAHSGAGLIVMHNRDGENHGGDIMTDMIAFFRRSLALAREAGVAEDRILLDPGIGFGKTRDQDEDVLARLPELAILGRPLLVGASRKRFIGRITGEEQPDRRGPGSIAAHLFAVNQGARVIRVHDVAEHRQALAVFSALQARKGSLTADV